MLKTEIVVWRFQEAGGVSGIMLAVGIWSEFEGKVRNRKVRRIVGFREREREIESKGKSGGGVEMHITFCCVGKR
ncbi:hypothetical protein HanIR_Chr08g0386971 [Helianthus annuus]|nr:hypothetical protein HanIR_Chr08g0386971 [Helianthus annuus]